jgi:hypothetical protein
MDERDFHENICLNSWRPFHLLRNNGASKRDEWATTSFHSLSPTVEYLNVIDTSILCKFTMPPHQLPEAAVCIHRVTFLTPLTGLALQP